MTTQTRNNRKTAPDLLGTLGKRPGRPKKVRTAEQIAASIDTEVKRLQGVADILRGKA